MGLIITLFVFESSFGKNGPKNSNEEGNEVQSNLIREMLYNFCQK